MPRSCRRKSSMLSPPPSSPSIGGGDGDGGEESLNGGCVRFRGMSWPPPKAVPFEWGLSSLERTRFIFLSRSSPICFFPVSSSSSSPPTDFFFVPFEWHSPSSLAPLTSSAGDSSRWAQVSLSGLAVVVPPLTDIVCSGGSEAAASTMEVMVLFLCLRILLVLEATLEATAANRLGVDLEELSVGSRIGLTIST